jgi:hypothetical protein
MTQGKALKSRSANDLRQQLRRSIPVLPELAAELAIEMVDPDQGLAGSEPEFHPKLANTTYTQCVTHLTNGRTQARDEKHLTNATCKPNSSSFSQVGGVEPSFIQCRLFNVDRYSSKPAYYDDTEIYGCKTTLKPYQIYRNHRLNESHCGTRYKTTEAKSSPSY